MLHDIEEQKPQPGYVLERLGELLKEARSLRGEAALERAAASVEALYQRVLYYRDGLLGLSVPYHENERHDILVEAFTEYSEALLDLFDVLSGEEDLYYPRLFRAIRRADRLLHRHRSAAAQGVGWAPSLT